MFYFGFGFRADFLIWIFIGAVVGYLFGELQHGRALGCLVNTVIGGLGGLIGGFVIGFIPGLGSGLGLGACAGLLGPALGALAMLLVAGYSGNQRVGGGRLLWDTDKYSNCMDAPVCVHATFCRITRSKLADRRQK